MSPNGPQMFCAFWALDIAPTWDVPVLLKFATVYKQEALMNLLKQGVY